MKLIQVPCLQQGDRYPTGCESVAATMLLRHLGCALTVDDFIRRYLPTVPFARRGGELWGPDPRAAFCGSPYAEDGMGCYAPVIRRALERALAELAPERAGAFAAVDETGAPVSALLKRYIDRDLPVIFWACVNMRPPVAGPSWRLLESGERFVWTSNEHCMLLVGYDEEGYYFNDPYEDNGLVRYPRALTERRHAAQRRMAVAVRAL